MKTFIQNTLEKIQRVPLHYWILGVILIVGIFLRTYEFRDWMVFNPDQARDALLVQDMIDGTTWPLMGPQAGSTFFKLGPIFYYFEYISAWLFGASAVHMAYPDLLFSLLTIIVVYFFLREFFEKNIALVTTFLFSISFFVVTYSRFAFNPNSIPFFTILFLFALLWIIDSAPKEKLRYAVMLGIVMGIGFQLHTLLFIAMPFLALLVLGYLFIKKHFIWKSVLVTLFFFFLFNAGQVVYEIQNRGANIQAFFSDVKSDSESAGRNYFRDFSNNVLCHIQGSTYIIASVGSGDKCDLTKLERQVQKRGVMINVQRIITTALGAIFLIGGWVLLWWYTKKEGTLRQKRALVLVGVYSIIIFFILLPVSSTVSIRYFITIEFVPFLLAGVWIYFILQKSNRIFGILGGGLFVVVLTVFNMQTTREAVILWRNGVASTDNVAYFGEVESMSKYVLAHASGSQIIYLAGKREYLSRYGKPLEYFAKQEGIILSKNYNKEKITVSDPFFYITKRTSERGHSAEVMKGFVTEGSATFGNVTIIKLIRKP